MEEGIPFTKAVIIRNVLVVSLAFLFLFTSFQASQNLQSTLNRAEGLGTWSLATIYGSLVASAILTPTILVRKLGCKWTMALSMLCYLVFMGANFIPVWGTMIPASVILGIAAAPLWAAKCTYLSKMAEYYSKLTKRTTDDVNNLFFGIFFMAFQSSQIWGNLVSSSIFSQREGNITDSDNITSCGSEFHPLYSKINSNLERPEEEKVYIVCGIYMGCSAAGFAIISVFLSRLPAGCGVSSDTSSCRLLFQTFRQLWKSHYQKLLVPLTIYSGLEQGFFSADFTRSYVGCTIGMWNVGYVMICYGIFDAACSILFGSLVKHTGHAPFLILAFLVHGGTLIWMTIWTPSSDDVITFYVIAALWGIGDAVIQTQINALYGDLFVNKTAAFSNYRLWESSGFIISFAYSNYLKTIVKQLLCLSFLITGMILYLIVEIHRKISSNKKMGSLSELSNSEEKDKDDLEKVTNLPLLTDSQL